MRISYRYFLTFLLLCVTLTVAWGQSDSLRIRYSNALTRGYALADSDPDKALEAFRAAQAIRPSDTIALQIAYLLNALDRNEEALEAFRPLTLSATPEFREHAHSAVFILDDMRREQRSPFWLRTSTAALYDSRFDDGILWLILQGGRRLNDAGTVSATLTLGIDADTRSQGGLLPEVFSDNYILLAPGLRWLPFDGITLELQAGAAYNTTLVEGRPRFEEDVRAVASYGIGVYPTPTVTERVRFDGTFFADLNASAGYYSRYTNSIAYLQGRAGIRMLDWGASAFDLYLRTDLSADSQREFFNNTIEAGLGLRVIPHHGLGVHLLFEARRGSYVGNTRMLGPGGSAYSTFRILAVWDRFF